MKNTIERRLKRIKDPVEQHVARVRVRSVQMNPVFRAIMNPTGFENEKGPR